jgi:hypothetical protein
MSIKYSCTVSPRSGGSYFLLVPCLKRPHKLVFNNIADFTSLQYGTKEEANEEARKLLQWLRSGKPANTFIPSRYDESTSNRDRIGIDMILTAAAAASSSSSSSSSTNRHRFVNASGHVNGSSEHGDNVGFRVGAGGGDYDGDYDGAGGINDSGVADYEDEGEQNAQSEQSGNQQDKLIMLEKENRLLKVQIEQHLIQLQQCQTRQRPIRVDQDDKNDEDDAILRLLDPHVIREEEGGRSLQKRKSKHCQNRKVAKNKNANEMHEAQAEIEDEDSEDSICKYMHTCIQYIIHTYT